MNASVAPARRTMGARDSVTQMLENHYLFLYAFALTTVRDREAAQEVAIATLSEALSRGLEKRPLQETRLALCRMALGGMALSTERTSTHDQPLGINPMRDAAEACDESREQRPNLDLAVALNRTWLRDALDAFSHRERQLMYLTHAAQMGYRDIAQVFDQPDTQVIAQLSHLQHRILDYLDRRSASAMEATDGS